MSSGSLSRERTRSFGYPVTDYARYQAQVTETAKTIPGYELVSGANSQSMVIQIEDPDDVASKNVKTFYYREQTVDIKYVAVGFGTLDKVQDSNVKVLSGTVQGSTPTPKPGYKFVGWYKDEGCTQQVDKTWVNTDTNKLTPQKSVPYGNQEGYRAATYYAKFERDVFDLTIEKKAANGSKIDQNQTFVFRVQGEGVNMQVVITYPANRRSRTSRLAITPSPRTRAGHGNTRRMAMPRRSSRPAASKTALRP